MKYEALGTTEISVSKICIGGMSFGKDEAHPDVWALDEKETEAMIGHAFDLGVNFIDTANAYAMGKSEEMIGKAVRSLGIPRDKIVIATKVFFNEGKLKKEAILREIDLSLKRLQMDYVDLYQIHRFDYDTPIEETMEALDSLVKAGKVRALGTSAMYGYQLHNMQLCAERNGWTLFSTLQNHYNLLYREDEHELIPVAQQYHMSLIPFSPLAAGHLARNTWNSGSARDQKDQTMHTKYDASMESDMKIVNRVEETAKKYGVSMSEVALAWHYAKGVTSPIVGATKVSHFDQAVKSVDLTLSEEDVKYLDELYVPHRLMGQIQHDGKMY